MIYLFNFRTRTVKEQCGDSGQTVRNDQLKKYVNGMGTNQKRNVEFNLQFKKSCKKIFF